MKNHKTILSLVLALFIVGLSFAQQGTVSGTVTDADGAPLPGATLLIKGTTTGVTTDFDGNFTIEADASAVLVASYVGFASQEITVGNQTNISFALQPSNELDEVVVVGYGSTTKKEITSAVTKVSEEEFNRGTVNSPSELLQGKVAGLSIYNKGGNPNEDAVIRLRGLSTVGANSQPLIVVDGIIGASLKNLDPNDVESMTVLKDGSAAAIYGSRASSGVILITTKRGKSGKTSITYNSSIASASIARKVENMTGNEFVAAGGTDLGARTDWLDLVTRNAITSIHNVAVSGGYDDTNFRMSSNFRDAEGILENSGFKQFNTRFQASTKLLNDKLRIDLTGSYTKRNSDYSFNEALRYAVLYNPTAPVLGVDSPYPFKDVPYGGYFETLGLFDSFNPASIINQNLNEGSRNEFIYGVKFKYNVTNNIILNATYSEQNNRLTDKEYYRTTSLFRGGADSPTRKGLARLYTYEDRFKLFELFGDVSFNASEKLDLKFTGGYSWQEETYFDYFLEAGDFPNNDLVSRLNFINALEWSQDQINAGFININSNASPEQRIIAFFGRLSATFDDAIYFNASVRHEGSTKLGENSKWGTFPAFGIGADLNKYIGWDNVDLFKVRFGYGVTGALPREYGLAQAGYEPDGSNPLVSVPIRQPNPDLRWEEKAETNFGIEFNSGHFGATLDIYSRKVSDLILEQTIEASDLPSKVIFISNNQFRNTGDITTNGFELGVNYDFIKSENLTYNSGLVFSTYKSTLDKFDGTSTLQGNLGAPGQNDTTVILVAEGEEIGQIYGPVWDGTVTNGSQNFVDVNGDGTIQTDQKIGNAIDADNNGVLDGDLTKLGKGIPDFELGWSHSLQYKNWDASLFFRGAFGHSMVNSFRVFYEPRVGSQGSYNYINTKYADPSITNAKFSSLYVEKADFVKLDNLQIGYAFNISEDNKYVESVRLSLSAQNLFTITSYTGADPEPVFSDRGSVDNGAFLSADPPNPLIPGIDRRYNYFLARTFTLGVNVNF